MLSDDPGQHRFRDASAAVGELAQAAEGADVALFYFSGHGMQFQQVNYLLPTDARLANEYDLVHRSISAQDIVTLLAARAKVVLVFLDACRSDPIEDDFRRRMAGQHRDVAPTRGLAPPVQTGAETMIVYATRPNEIAADGTGRHSRSRTPFSTCSPPPTRTSNSCCATWRRASATSPTVPKRRSDLQSCVTVWC